MVSQNPVYGVRGGIRVPVKPHREFPNGKLCESKLVRRKDLYIAVLTFEFPDPPMQKCSSILAVDLVSESALQRCCGKKA
ncbi:hypothetical protein KEJ34_09330 [Candidatus Bathyarchaeota archaeon]|nr:hypothetical protein [Candidatus Bathyarchaeota archaeon]